jgi:hypothetical protein
LATGIALALLIGVGACSKNDPPPSADHRTTSTRAATSTSSTTTSTTTTKPKTGYVKAKVDPSLPRQDIDINLRYPASFTPAQVEVVQAWANYRHVFYATADPPEPNSEWLGRVATSEAVAVLKDQRQQLKQQGRAGRVGRGRLSETVYRVTTIGDHAQLLTCQVDGVVQVLIATGSVVNDDVTTRLVAGELVHVADGWRIAPGQERASWPGREEKTCADSL